MNVHNFDRIPYFIVKLENGEKLYDYRCQDCGLIYVHDSLLDDSDFEYSDYLAYIPCKLGIDKKASNYNE